MQLSTCLYKDKLHYHRIAVSMIIDPSLSVNKFQFPLIKKSLLYLCFCRILSASKVFKINLKVNLKLSP